MNSSSISPKSLDESKQAKVTQRQLVGLMANLVVVFILGAALTTVVNYQPDKHSVWQTIILILHILVAIGALAMSITRLVFAVKSKQLVGLSAAGLAFIVVAFASGAAAAGSGNNWAVFIMALGFIGAFACYGISFRQLAARS